MQQSIVVYIHLNLKCTVYARSVCLTPVTNKYTIEVLHIAQKIARDQHQF